LIRDSPGLAARIDNDAPFCWAEVVYSLANEYVERIDDLLDRRLGAFILAPGIDLAEKTERWILEHQGSALDGRHFAGSQP
jgi:glycerol-3-phosphate dehydrogenase